MGKRKVLNGESSNGVAVAEDSGSEEVRPLVPISFIATLKMGGGL
jgi:hypothetical protein